MSRYRARTPVSRWSLLGQSSAMAIVAAFGLAPAAFAQDISLETGGGYDMYHGQTSEQYIPEEFGAINGTIAPDDGYNGLADLNIEAGRMLYRAQVQYGHSTTSRASTSYASGKYTASATASHTEHYWIGDVMVGRDIGIGGGLQAQIYGGVRYADFTGETRVHFTTSSKYGGVSDDLTIQRDFRGFGPVVAVHVLAPVGGTWGFEGDLSVAALFGESRARGDLDGGGNFFNRSENRTVTDFGGRMGVVWTPGGPEGAVRVRVGYRFEILTDLIDSGFDDPDQLSNRYIDGPFASVVWRLH